MLTVLLVVIGFFLLRPVFNFFMAIVGFFIVSKMVQEDEAKALKASQGADS